MKPFASKANLLATTIFCGAAIGFAAPAYAQDDDSSAQDQADLSSQDVTAADDDAAIVITGSRIRRPNVDSTVPITSVAGEEFFQTATTSVGDTLNDLPSLRSTYSQSNAGRFLGTVGLNLLDLRGLGTQRTLVLVNGRRHVPADILVNGVSPDVNTISADLIERVDIVTGGNSAIYGSDAIAGVVNFILRRDFEGIQLRGQGGLTTYGDAGSYVASVTAGTNFADGRGNITVNAEYAHQDILYQSDRSYLLRNDGFLTVDTDPAGSDGNPDRIFFRDIRGATINAAGMFSFAQQAATAQCGVDPRGTAYNCNYVFTRDGVLVPQTGTRVGLGPNGSFIGGNGDSNREENLAVIYPDNTRYVGNLLAHYTFSPAFELFTELKYARVETFGRSSGPAFVQGSSIGEADGGGGATFRERIRLDNPFLPQEARDIILQFNPAATAATRTPFRKNFLDLGVRDEDNVRQTYRGVIGVRGDFNDDWSYEISANYGRFTERNRIQGNINIQRFLLAIDSGIDPATNTIRCRSQFDPAAQRAYGNDAALAADIAACVPLNPFGRTTDPAARDYILADTTSTARITQFTLNAFMSGDSSAWFELPGGPVGFAIGAEYRRERLLYQADPLVESGVTFYNAIPTFDSPVFDVKEIFGEVRFPLLRDTPFFQELTVSGAARYADYNLSGGAFAFNAGVEWSPIRDLRLRGNFSRAVRAPNLTETAFPPGQNFAPGFQDPCSAAYIGAGSSTRAANCAADGVNPAFALNLTPYSLELVSGSNPNLREEKSDSWTLGFVYQPHMVPGLSLSVDYYDITVDDVIASPTPQQIADACYDAADINNQFCDLFERWTGPGNGPADEVPGQILQTSLLQVPVNYAALTARGIDTEIAYRHRIEGLGTLNARLVYTHVLERTNYLNPVTPEVGDRILSEAGDPQNNFVFNLDLNTGPWTIGYQMRYVGRSIVQVGGVGEYEDFFSFQGRPPQNADFADRIWTPSALYHDFRVNFNVNEAYEFSLGVDNAFNRRPPLGLTGNTVGGGTYDVRGRAFYAGFRARF